MSLLKNYIDGQWTDASTRDAVDVLNPATGELLARTPLGGQAEIEAAVVAAERAFEAWGRAPAVDRIQPLFRLKMLLEQNLDELSRICTRENGKTLAESKAELRRAIQMVETACGMPSLLIGQAFEEIAPGIDCVAIRKPMGVFAAITPFNFPAMISFWFWPFGVACGNTFIVKPSERVPMTQMRIFELIAEAGFPKGVVNLVHGGKDAVNAICRHPRIRGVSFVGSTPVARHVYREGTQAGKRVQALGGSKNFMVVLKDAVMDKAVRTIVESAVGCAGERCLAASVMLAVGDDVYNELKGSLARALREVTVGDGLQPSTVMGPVISAEAKARIAGLIQSAVDEGAELVVDGRAGAEGGALSRGYFLKPSLIAGVRKGMRVAEEEIFGPVICLAKVGSFDEAVKWINSSPFANTTSLFTTSGPAAREFMAQVDPSMIGINIGVPAPMSFFSFGGTKDSFFGDVKAHGQGCVTFFTDTKTTIQRWIKDGSIW